MKVHEDRNAYERGMKVHWKGRSLRGDEGD